MKLKGLPEMGLDGSVLLTPYVPSGLTGIDDDDDDDDDNSHVVTDSLLDLMFHCLSCHANWSSVLKPFHPLKHSPLTETTVSILNLHSSVDSRRFHAL